MIVRRDVPLSHYVWYRIGGPARYLLNVRRPADLWDAIEFVDRHRPSRVIVIGQGSNLLMSDEYFDGAVIRVAAEPAPSIEWQGDGRLQVFGGALLDEVAIRSLDLGMTGLEWAGGLPGTIGAAVRGNVGAFGHEIEQSVQQVSVVSFGQGGWQERTLDWADLTFSYRNSRVKHVRNSIVSTVMLQLQPSSGPMTDAARSVYFRSIGYRTTRHPMEDPNCGSVFKNLERADIINMVVARWPDIEPKIRTEWHGKVSMGYLIGRLGMAGMRVGSAQVSAKHHNFIVNLGGARASDVRSLISRIRAKVEEMFGFVPEVEIEVVD